MATEMCPICGAARTGSFRFCRTCGLDFDAPVSGTPTDVGGVLAPAGVVGAAEPDAAPGRGSTAGSAKGQPGGDVIVIQVRLLKLWAGLLIGGLIGAMVAGAVIVPLFGEKGVLFGSIAAIVTVVVFAFLGWRFAKTLARR